MPSTEERIRQLVDENLRIEGRPQGQPLSLESTLRDTGASPMAIVAFLVKLIQEFSFDVAPEDFAQIADIGDLIEFIDTRVR